MYLKQSEIKRYWKVAIWMMGSKLILKMMTTKMICPPKRKGRIRSKFKREKITYLRKKSQKLYKFGEQTQRIGEENRIVHSIQPKDNRIQINKALKELISSTPTIINMTWLC